MKRYNNLLSQILDINNMYQAMLNGAKNKKNRIAVRNFVNYAQREIQNLKLEVENQNYCPKEYHRFFVYEPKKREICAPHFRDVVLQHAIYQVLYPIFDKSFLACSHGCRKKRGVHSAVNYLQAQMRQCDDEKYYLQMDIKRFYYSISKNTLRALMERKIKDVNVINLCMQFTNKEAVGLPIGNLLSQLFGLIYLNPLDTFIKRELRCKKFVRYVDDFVILDLTLEEAQATKVKIEQFLKGELGLELSKCHIAKIKRGINFTGYRIWKTHRLVRKHTLYRFKKHCKSGNVRSVLSSIANAKHTQSLRYYLLIAKKYAIFKQLPNFIQRRING